MNENKYYVYVYLNPLKNGLYNYNGFKFLYEPFYVGKGCGSRLYDHLYSDKCNIIKTEIIEELLEMDIEPIIIKYKQYLFEDESYELEKKLIKNIGRIINNKGPLSNIQPGGAGFKGWVITENWLKRNKEGQIKRWSKIENHIQLSKSLKKAFRKKEVRKKMSNIMKKEWKDPIKRKNRILAQNTKYVKIKKSKASIKGNSLIWELISPEGKEYKTNRLKLFCKNFNLDVESMQRIAMGKRFLFEGWFCCKEGTKDITEWRLNFLRLQKLLVEYNKRRKLKITSTGRIKSNEEKQKIGKASTGNKYGCGYKHTLEAKLKIGEASKQRWENKRNG